MRFFFPFGQNVFGTSQLIRARIGNLWKEIRTQHTFTWGILWSALPYYKQNTVAVAQLAVLFETNNLIRMWELNQFSWYENILFKCIYRHRKFYRYSVVIWLRMNSNSATISEVVYPIQLRTFVFRYIYSLIHVLTAWIASFAIH